MTFVVVMYPGELTMPNRYKTPNLEPVPYFPYHEPPRIFLQRRVASGAMSHGRSNHSIPKSHDLQTHAPRTKRARNERIVQPLAPPHLLSLHTKEIPRANNPPPSSWDTTYTHDLITHATTPSHTGQTWFEDVNASRKILNYLTAPSSSRLALDKRTTTFLDLGTGNGEMLFLLREEGGFEGRMVGVDYSAGSVQLCRQLAASKRGSVTADEGWEERGGGVGMMEFVQWDILHSPPHASWTQPGFDVVLDKGTFDAVSLSAETDEGGRRVCEGYRGKVEGLVRKGGVVVVTSCNWTEEELVGWFEGGGGLEMCGRVEYPVFWFGGRQGQSVQSLVFRRTG